MTDDRLHLRVATEAPPAAVFKALTDADDLSEWFAESAEIDLDENRYEFWGRYAPQGDRPRQTLLAASPESGLRYTWTFDDGPSTVELAIAEDSVTLTHEGVPPSLAGALRCFWHVSLANLVAFAEGLQTMPPFDFSVPAQGDALVRTVIDVSPDEVYASLLDPAQVSKWTQGSAVIEITEEDPDKALTYAWQAADGTTTTVRWTLRSSRGSTFLTVVHTGFADDALAEEQRQAWPPYLVELKRLLEQGDRWQPMAA